MEEQIIKDYVDNLLTFSELSEKYHRGKNTISNILRTNNVHIRSAEETKILKKNKDKKLTYEQLKNKVIDNYVNKQWGQIKSGAEFYLSAATVKKILQENNIPIRDFHTAIQITNSNDPRNIIYSKDENFFSKESRNMAWLIGFLAADGNISKKDNLIRIELSYVDEEILHRIKDAVKIENPIKYREDKRGRKFCCLGWSSRQHKKDLEKYSIIPNKTFVLNPPYNLSFKYSLDYIRGFFDGDGTININMCHDGKSKAIRFGICSASKPVLEWIVEIFEQYGVKPVKPHVYKAGETDMWNIIYSSNASRQIYKLLYSDIQDDILFLKRKKDKYEKILNEIPERVKNQETL